MIIGKQNIIEFLRFNNTPNWRIRRSEKTHPIFESNGDDITLDEGITQIEGVLRMLAPGSYFIESWEGNNRKDWKKDTIILNDTADKNNVSGITGIYSPEDIDKKIADGIEQYKRNEHYRLLEEENKRLREEQDSLTSRVLTRLEPHLGLILKALVPENPNITGIKKKVTTNNESMPQEKNVTDLNQRAENALAKWFELDNQAVDLIERIVHLAENDPDTYNMAKNFLKKG